MKGKIKRVLAVALCTCSSLCSIQAKANVDFLSNEALFVDSLGALGLGLTTLFIYNKLSGSESKSVNSKKSCTQENFNSNSVNKIPYSSWEEEKKDASLKAYFEKELENMKSNTKLYSDIDTYSLLSGEKNHTTINNDVQRPGLTGVPEEVTLPLQENLKKILHCVHKTDNVDYYQGYQSVCMGICLMIRNYLPNIDKSLFVRLCASIYSKVLHTLKDYSKYTTNLCDGTDVPKFFDSNFEKLSERYSKIEISLGLNSASMNCLWGLGINGIQSKCCRCSSVGSWLLKRVLLKVYGKITKEQLESDLSDVMYMNCVEVINSLPNSSR